MQVGNKEGPEGRRGGLRSRWQGGHDNLKTWMRFQKASSGRSAQKVGDLGKKEGKGDHGMLIKEEQWEVVEGDLEKRGHFKEECKSSSLLNSGLRHLRAGLQSGWACRFLQRQHGGRQSQTRWQHPPEAERSIRHSQ